MGKKTLMKARMLMSMLVASGPLSEKQTKLQPMETFVWNSRRKLMVMQMDYEASSSSILMEENQESSPTLEPSLPTGVSILDHPPPPQLMSVIAERRKLLMEPHLSLT